MYHAATMGYHSSRPPKVTQPGVMQNEESVDLMEQVLFHEEGPTGLQTRTLSQEDLRTLCEDNVQLSLGAVDLLLHRAAVKLRQRTQSTRRRSVRVVGGVTFHLWLAWAAVDSRGRHHPPRRKMPVQPPKSLTAGNWQRARYIIMPMQLSLHREHKYYRTCVLVQPGM